MTSAARMPANHIHHASRPDVTFGSANSWALTAALFAATLIVYLAFPTAVYYWDGVYFAQAIERGTAEPAGLLHPNHLLYNALGYELWKFSAILGQPRALTVLRVFNSIVGAASASLVFLILEKLVRSRRIAACLSLGFAFSATWWRFAIDAGAYVPSTFLLIVAVALIATNRRASPITVGVVHAASMLFHQLGVLFYPAAVVGLCLCGKPTSVRERMSSVLWYTLVAASCTIGMYWLAWANHANAFRSPDFAHWITSHSSDAAFSFELGKNLIASVVGHGKLLLGGRLRAATWDALSTLLATATLIMLLVLVARLRKMPPAHALQIKPRFVPIMAVSCVWIVSYVLFLFFWLPQNTFYRLFYLPAIFILSATVFSMRAGRDLHWLPIALIALFLFNLTFSIYPQSKPTANPLVQAAILLNERWSPGTIVYFDVYRSDNQITRYFNPQVEWVELWGHAWLNQIGASVAKAATDGGSLWFDETALIEFVQTDSTFRQWFHENCVVGPRESFKNGESAFSFVRLHCQTLQESQ